MKSGLPEQLVGVESIEHQEASVPRSPVSVIWESNWAAPSCDCLAYVYGNAVDRSERQRRYPTDTTDGEWAAIRPLLPMPGWMRGRGGQPEAYCHRAMVDAIRYLVDNGIKWRAMPVDFPPWDRVYAFFRRWRDHGLVKEFHDRLRGQVRERLGRDTEPTAGVIDSQSVKADAVVGADSRGFDGGKLINGRYLEPARACPSCA
ncbi:transposase [Streptomyces violaceusniger]|uniref:transposase n=1 Tax=Streptomyces violaceusniger TaxID=68280 RepID=UPI0031E2A4AF